MNAARFDRLTRTIRYVSSRRGLMRGLAVTCGLAAIPAPGTMEAKSKNTKRLKLNAFGCVAVGKACRGRTSGSSSSISPVGRNPSDVYRANATAFAGL